jgi:hypothetical protein
MAKNSYSAALPSAFACLPESGKWIRKRPSVYGKPSDKQDID